MNGFFDKLSRILTGVINKIGKRNLSLALCIILFSVLSVTLLILNNGKKNTNYVESVVSASSEVSSEVSSVESVTIPEKLLEMVNPTVTDAETKEDTFTFTGSSDPEAPLLVNGSEIERDENGNFSHTVKLQKGKNSFTFTHKEQTLTYNVTYKYVVINSYSPSKAQTLNSGSIMGVNVSARAGSTVTAEFNGKKITLKKTVKQDADESDLVSSDTFCDFSGSFELPSDNATDLSLGKIKFKATYDGVTDTYYSGKITVKRNTNIKLVATVICRSAETFNGNTNDDNSRPINNYLPEGTVDYCDEGYVTNGDNTYVKLRCGRRIYLTCNPGKDYEYAVAEVKVDELPDHNELTFVSMKNGGRYTTLKISPMWKAPFLLELKDQNYRESGSSLYTVDNVTFSYVDIKFCYATKFEGEFTLPKDNPLFKSFEIINNGDSHTLRLYLKKTGGFYGWDSFYDEDGNLTFEFLNPATMKNENSLEGIKIFIDVGHGGKDGGASYYDSNNNEAVRNLVLANKTKAKLEAMGATVKLSRYDNSTYLTPLERMNAIRDFYPDFCIAIHHDSNSKTSLNGGGVYHFNAYSKAAAAFVDETIDATGVYRTNYNVRWHYYYGNRISNCPSILTENGYMSNREDFDDILNDNKNEIKAQAIADGILKYFKSIQ